MWMSWRRVALGLFLLRRMSEIECLTDRRACFLNGSQAQLGGKESPSEADVKAVLAGGAYSSRLRSFDSIFDAHCSTFGRSQDKLSLSARALQCTPNHIADTDDDAFLFSLSNHSRR